MATSNFPNGFTNGVTIKGLPITSAQPGKVFFINNSSILAPGGIAGSDLGPGTYQRPFQTLNGAINNGKVVANRGDILMIMPGHAETIANASAMSLATAGVGIIGLGTGALRPTFTLGTANTATIAVAAAGISVVNCLFIANFAAIASCFTLANAPGFTVSQCEFRDTSSILNFVNIVKTSATSNQADALTVEKCQMYGLGATSNTCLVNFVGTNDRPTIINNYVAHAAVTGGGLFQTASTKNVTNLICDNNSGVFVGATGLTTGVLAITGGTANTGLVSKNYCKGLDVTTPILVTAASGLGFNQNYYQSVADSSGALLPASA